MKKNLKLFALLLISITVFSCKKNETDNLDIKASSYHQKSEKLSLNQKRSSTTSYGYVFDWANSISLENELNDECASFNVWFSTEQGQEYLILSDQIVAAGGAPARGGLIGGISGYGGYGANQTGLLTFEEGANQEIDDFCECVIAHSPVPLVQKMLY